VAAAAARSGRRSVPGVFFAPNQYDGLGIQKRESGLTA